MVAVLSHSNHAYQHGQTEQREADGGLGQPCAFGLEHQCHIHLERGKDTTQDTCAHMENGCNQTKQKLELSKKT